MKRNSLNVVIAAGAALLLVSMACGGTASVTPPAVSDDSTPTIRPASGSTPTIRPAGGSPPTIRPAGGPTKTVQPTGGGVSGEIRQWVSTASASSSFGDPDWAATQATGAPDTIGCGDFTTAWASSSPSGVDWLDAGFTTPVVPTQINIYETFNPGSIVKVEVRSMDGGFHTVWQGSAQVIKKCPRVFTINISKITVPVNAVLISVDQSTSGNWDEIDAVELVGKP